MARIEITRGDIVLVDLSGAIGSEHQNHSVSNTRPCVVVQNDGGNKASPVTIVAPITDDGSYKGYPQQVKATAAQVHGIKESIIHCGQLRTIDRDSRIKRNVGKVAEELLPEIDKALRASLGLR
jgi:mRNA interferase MazF